MLQDENAKLCSEMQEVQSQLWILQDRMDTETNRSKSEVTQLTLLQDDVRAFKKEFKSLRDFTVELRQDFQNYASKVLSLEWESKRMKTEFVEVLESLKELQVRAEEIPATL